MTIDRTTTLAIMAAEIFAVKVSAHTSMAMVAALGHGGNLPVFDRAAAHKEAIAEAADLLAAVIATPPTDDELKAMQARGELLSDAQLEEKYQAWELMAQTKHPSRE